jgi:hypothetical protein
MADGATEPNWKELLSNLKSVKMNAPQIRTYYDDFTQKAIDLMESRDVTEEDKDYFLKWTTFLRGSSSKLGAVNTHIANEQIKEIKIKFKKINRPTNTIISLCIMKDMCLDLSDQNWVFDKDIEFTEDLLFIFMPVFTVYFSREEQKAIKMSCCKTIFPEKIKKEYVFKYFDFYDQLLTEITDYERLILDKDIDKVKKIKQNSDDKIGRQFDMSVNKENYIYLINKICIEELFLRPTIFNESIDNEPRDHIQLILNFIKHYPFRDLLRGTSIVEFSPVALESIVKHIQDLFTGPAGSLDDRVGQRIAPEDPFTYYQQQLLFLKYVLTALIDFKNENCPDDKTPDEFILDNLDTLTTDDNKTRRLFHTYTFRTRPTGRSWMTEEMFKALDAVVIPYSNIVALLNNTATTEKSFKAIYPVLQISLSP